MIVIAVLARSRLIDFSCAGLPSAWKLLSSSELLGRVLGKSQLRLVPIAGTGESEQKLYAALRDLVADHDLAHMASLVNTARTRAIACMSNVVLYLPTDGTRMILLALTLVLLTDVACVWCSQRLATCPS